MAHLQRLGALKRVWQPVDDQRAVFKCAAQAYLDAVHRQTALKLQLKAHYRPWGIIPSGSLVYSKRVRHCYLAQVLQAGVRAQLELLYQALDSALEVERQARRHLVAAGKGYPEIERLRTVPGVGRIGAHLFLAYLQKPTRLAAQASAHEHHFCRTDWT